MTSPPAPFIVGMGRSGTTLLRLMIDSHPLIAIPPETQFISTLNWSCGRDEFIRHVTSHRRWPDFHLDADALAETILNLPDFSVAEGLRAFYRAYAARFAKPRWGDKTPTYSERMTEIAKALPEAGFIHIIRDGRDSALSHRGLWFGPGADLAAHARVWRQTILWAREQAANATFPYMEVRFENLILTPDAELRRICSFLDVDFDSSMLKYHQRAADRIGELEGRKVEGNLPGFSKEEHRAIFARTSSPPDPDRIGVWRRDMSESEQEAYTSIAGDLLTELGYA
ncbi:MAG: sulfotransferase [Rhizobiaceae bacterium]|nr:sulfotransferase [Rhizobiaceae bacterium]